ncbi:hypothetical protein POSPLADRAFT_1113956, partial [Postia placenta MAD-698-R-SB12]
CNNVTTITLNATMTGLICGCLLYYAWRLRGQLGDDSQRAYIYAISIIVESALPYTVRGVIFLVTY